jgi:hypothetical protein
MKNPIPHSSLFGTPRDLEALDQQIRSLNTEAERALAYTYTMLAFNLAYKMVEAEKAGLSVSEAV